MAGRTQVFISYAHNEHDLAVARQLHRDLLVAGHSPWMDKENLLPGDDWAMRIEREIRECKQFIALLSSRSLNKRGFVQSELGIALEVLNTIPIDERFLIPVRVEPCIPKDRRLARLHFADLFPDYAHGIRQVLRALEQGKQIPGRLWIDVGVEIPTDIASWPDDRLCPYIEKVLWPEARERAHRDYEYVSVRDLNEAVAARAFDKLAEVAERYGFLDGLRRCVGREETGNAG